MVELVALCSSHEGQFSVAEPCCPWMPRLPQRIISSVCGFSLPLLWTPHHVSALHSNAAKEPVTKYANTYPLSAPATCETVAQSRQTL